MLVGLVVVVPPLAAAGRPHGIGARELGWLAISGAGNVGGLFFVYAAYRVGKVSIISPIASTEGAIAALAAVVEGEHLGVRTAVLLALIVVAVVLASRGEDRTSPGAHTARASALAGGAALCFGASLFATGRVSQTLPLAWALLPPRLLGVIAVSLPLAARRRLAVVRPAVPYVVVAGLCEVAGFASYSFGARHGIAVAAVLASQFAAFAVVGSFVVFHERLRRLQVAGIGGVVVCVAVLSALRA
jgi:drug/metabolite transporter (DMT)-like permease